MKWRKWLEQQRENSTMAVQRRSLFRRRTADAAQLGGRKAPGILQRNPGAASFILKNYARLLINTEPRVIIVQNNTLKSFLK